MASGTSTPATLVSVPSSPKLKGALLENGPSKLVQASDAIEYLASRSSVSSTVYVYDVAEQAGFGSQTKAWANSDKSTASVVSMQTRAGAGLSLVGRLSQGTGTSEMKGAVLTAYTTPTGLSAMAQSLSYLPPASPSSRLVLQVPTVITVGESFSLSPSLAPLAATLSLLPESIVVLLSATPRESVDLATLAYTLTSSHVIHLFDHFSSSRELGHDIAPSPAADIYASVSVADAIQQAGYSFFDYSGDKNATTVVVALNGPLALAAKALASKVSGLGVVVVRVLRPWDEAAFREVLPSSVKQVHVLDDVPNSSTQGSLYIDVFGALLDAESRPSIHAHRIIPALTQSYLAAPSSFLDFLLKVVPGASSPAPSLDTSTTKKLVFFSTPNSSLSVLPLVIEKTFAAKASISARKLTDHDVISRQGGITTDRLILSQKADEGAFVPIPITLPVPIESDGHADFIGVLDSNLLKSHNLLQHAKHGSAVLVATSWTSPELLSYLPAEATSLVLERNLRICLFDGKAAASDLVGADGPAHDDIENLLVHLAFLRLYLGKAASEATVLRIASSSFPDSLHGVDLIKINARAWATLVEVEIPEDALSPESITTGSVLKQLVFNAIAVETDEGETVVNGATLGSWHDAAKHLLFPSVFTPPAGPSEEEYPQNPSLRPEIPDHTFLVTTTVNRRLTPLEYDRNVFHLEFDTSGTGLKYAIGEALGVHGWNDEKDVLDFCQWFGADPQRLVTIPIMNGEGKMHTRTVFQALQQQIDLYGKPPKSFYTDLAAYATAPIDRYALLFIGAPEGYSTFKKMSEKDTLTFADVLRLYPSAKPGIETLCELVGDIKPRHYSIASAQSVVGDRVDLLVVSVEWANPSGSPRFGQCTRYLAGLKIGQKVTVSIKPSVMKLPAKDTQPIIMAGLGTGAAPFRAFLQHRAHLASQGIPVGSSYYYFGSRRQSEEYLYGEEIEAFINAGTITRAGLAFSRDGPDKVYIQHKMLEDAEALADIMLDQEGTFYLCGPTWPVPDVYEALVGALVKYKGQDRETAGAYLEGLKEEERYVLEVY